MRICMVSDFFYPNTGGVETHIWQLSQKLIELGHSVIVMTHAYGDRIGLHRMTNGLRVYYLTFPLFPGQNIIWPLVFNTFATTRQVLIREQINIVHGHSVFSPMAHQAVLHAKALGIHTVFTDHSLFGLNSYEAILHSNIVRQSLMQCNHIICVSRVGKSNEALNFKTREEDFIPISVIPNAVDSSAFTPDYTKRNPNNITIIVNSRLVYRKGIHLLAAALPKICDLNPKVHFIIAGDGPKRIQLENAISQFNLYGRVTLLGSVPHERVRDILVRGDIFLNTSLIEAFCMAIVEAASCGLPVVSTNVGGLPGVLPPQLIKLTEPNVDSIVEGIRLTLDDIENNKLVPPHEAHRIIRQSYSWNDVAKRTERVYFSVNQNPTQSLTDRLKRYAKSRSIFGFIFIALTLINHILSLILNWLSPRQDIFSHFAWRERISEAHNQRDQTRELVKSDKFVQIESIPESQVEQKLYRNGSRNKSCPTF